VTLSDEAIAAIEAALKRGHNVEVRRYKDGVIVSEVRKTIKYRDIPKGD
jgi:hypothetical protein